MSFDEIEIEEEFDDYKTAYLDCENELNDEEKKQDAAVMKELNRELKSVKATKFKDFKDIMEDYSSGDPVRVKQAKEDACMNLKGFIVYMIMHNFWTYCRNNFYDMLQSGYIGVIKGMEVYNVERSKPTTFFKTYIKSEISRFITEFLNHSTVHYASALNKINKAIRYFEANNIEYNEVTLAEYTGISLVSVKEALASKEAAINVNYQDELENSSGDSLAVKSGACDNPEKYLEDKDKETAVATALTVLTPTEKQIMLSHYGFEGNALSFKDIAINLGLAVSQVKAFHQRAINKLQATNLREFCPDKYASESWLDNEYDFFPESEDEEEVEIVAFTFDKNADVTSGVLDE